MASPGWSRADRGLFLLVVLAWGFNYLFVTVGLRDADPLWLATLRAAVGAIAVLAIVTPLHAWGRLDAAGRRDALLLGIPNTALFFGLWFTAAQSVLPGFASVVVYTFPLWVAMLASPLLGHQLGGRHWLAVALGFTGVALISQVWAVAGGGISLAPVLELLGAAFAWALGTVLFQRRFRREELLEANAYQLFGGAAALAAATLLWAPRPWPDFGSPTLWGAVAWLGIFGTAIAYTIWFRLLGRTRAATLSAYVFLVPVVALSASALLLGERLSVLQLVGVAFVLASIYGIGRSPQAREDPGAGAAAPRGS